MSPRGCSSLLVSISEAFSQATRIMTKSRSNQYCLVWHLYFLLDILYQCTNLLKENQYRLYADCRPLRKFWMPENISAVFHDQNRITRAYLSFIKTSKKPENTHEIIKINENKRSFLRTELLILHPKARQTNKCTYSWMIVLHLLINGSSRLWR